MSRKSSNSNEGKLPHRWGFEILKTALGVHGLLNNLWVVSVDGEQLPEPKSLAEIGQLFQNAPTSRVRIRILELDGSLSAESPWLEVFDDKLLMNCIFTGLAALCLIGGLSVGYFVTKSVMGDWAKKLAWGLLSGILTTILVGYMIHFLFDRIIPYAPAFLRGAAIGMPMGMVIFGFIGALFAGEDGATLMGGVGAMIAAVAVGLAFAVEEYAKRKHYRF